MSAVSPKTFLKSFGKILQQDFTSNPMVRSAAQNCGGTVQLFRQHHPHQQVRPDHLAKTKGILRPIPQDRRYAIRAADDKGHVLPPIITPFRQMCCKFRRGYQRAAFVQRHNHCTGRNRAAQQIGLGDHAAALFILNLMFNNRANPQRTPAAVNTLQIIIDQSPLWSGAQPPYCTDMQPHGRSGPAMGAAGQPHLFKIIELAHFGAEDVNDHIASINQHPIAGFFAFHLGNHPKLLL